MANYDTHISNDIILIIFSSLPKSALARFRCVCKSWLPLIDDCLYNGALLVIDQLPKYFATESKDYTISIFYRRRLEDDALRAGTRFVPLFLPGKGQEFVLRSTGVGLLCYATARNNNDIGSLFGHSVYVFNPLTKEVLTVPEDPSRSLASSFGVGYDSSTRTYKIVHVFKKSWHDWEVEIHTLGTTSWRKIDARPIRCPDADIMPVFANEALHWSQSVHGEESDIISFDMTEEIFYWTRRPPAEKFHLAELNGNLAMLDQSRHNIYGYETHVHVRIWTLKGKGLNWVVEYRINTGKLFDSEYDGDVGELEIMGIWNDGGFVAECGKWKWNNDEILLRHNQKGYISYQIFENQTSEYVWFPSRKYYKDHSTGVVAVKGSFFSLASLI